MGIANKIVSYKKKNWDKSKYKPKRMINATTEITQEIMSTCKNLNQLSNVVSNIASELHSSEFSKEANQLDYLIGEVNKTMSKTSTSIINDLASVCDLISQKNASLNSDMVEIKTSLSNCEVELERYSR